MPSSSEKGVPAADALLWVEGKLLLLLLLERGKTKKENKTQNHVAEAKRSGWPQTGWVPCP